MARQHDLTDLARAQPKCSVGPWATSRWAKILLMMEFRANATGDPRRGSKTAGRSGQLELMSHAARSLARAFADRWLAGD